MSDEDSGPTKRHRTWEVVIYPGWILPYDKTVEKRKDRLHLVAAGHCKKEPCKYDNDSHHAHGILYGHNFIQKSRVAETVTRLFEDEAESVTIVGPAERTVEALGVLVDDIKDEFARAVRLSTIVSKAKAAGILIRATPRYEEGWSSQGTGDLEAKLSRLRETFSDGRPTFRQWSNAVMQTLRLETTTKTKPIWTAYYTNWELMDKKSYDANAERKRKMVEMAEKVLKTRRVDATVKTVGKCFQKWFNACTIRCPKDVNVRGLEEKRRYALCIMYLMSKIPRPAGADVKQLYVSGQPGVGKSTLARLIAGDDRRIHRLAGDAMGVGRFETGDAEIIFVDEAVSRQMNNDFNVRTINSVADGQKTTVKVHGSVVDIEPTWIIMTSNATLDDVEGQAADGLTCHRRRYVELTPSVCFDDTELMCCEETKKLFSSMLAEYVRRLDAEANRLGHFTSHDLEKLTRLVRELESVE